MTSCPKCGKVRHASEADAWAHICSLRKSGGYTADMTPYKCGKWWHVGHSQTKLIKRIRRSIRRGRKR